MDPHALFLYLVRRHFTEDIAQEVVIAYLAQEGTIRYPKAWGLKWARGLAGHERKKQARMVPLDPQLPIKAPDALTRAAQRQEIERSWPLKGFSMKRIYKGNQP